MEQLQQVQHANKNNITYYRLSTQARPYLIHGRTDFQINAAVGGDYGQCIGPDGSKNQIKRTYQINEHEILG